MNPLGFLLCLFLLAASVHAQKPEQVAGTKSSSNNTAAQKEAEALQEIRRQAAVGALNLLSQEARSYRDDTLRARVQARIADALWERDPESARSLFRRAWEAAEAVEGQAATNEIGSAPARVSNRPTSRPRMILRSEVLRLAAKRDHALGEEFLAKLTAPKDETQQAGDLSGSSAANLSPAVIAQRLRLATQFLEDGQLERALQFADPALVQIVGPTISFLIALREKNAAAADQRFASLLSRAAADASADANTVSLLTSYAFTPSMSVVVSNTGIPSIIMNSEPRPAPVIAPALRNAFFRVASGILLKPTGVLDHTSAGRAGTYYIAARLFPLFQQYAPDIAPLISAQLNALRADAQQAINVSERKLTEGLSPANPTGGRVDDDLEDRLSRARNADERDRAYAFAAMRAADSGDSRAPDFADKIEDSETRNGVRRFVDYNLIRGLLRKKNVDEALRLTAKSDLSRAHRTAILSSAAGLLSKTDRARALALLDESLEEARRIDAATPERAYAMVGLLSRFSKLAPTRTWALAEETVKSANAVSDFSGENGQIQILLEGKFSIRMGVSLASPTDLAEAFGELAADDAFHALSLAEDFAGDAPRALATIAAARAILNRKLIVHQAK